MTIDPHGNTDSEARSAQMLNSILGIVVTLILLAGGVAFWLSTKETLTEHQLEMWLMSKEVCFLGCTAIFGLLGFKLFAPKSD